MRGLGTASSGVGLVLLASAAVLCATGLTPRAPAPAQYSARELLDLYDRGEYDAVVADLSAREGKLRPDLRREPGPIAHFHDDLQRAGPVWIDAAGPAAAPRRRLVAAAVALEAAHSMPPLFADPFVRFDAQLDDRYSLLDWAPTILLKSATAPPSERWWWLAAMASIQGQADSSQALKHGEALVRLAEARFPDERRFLFEQGLFEDEQANPALIAFPGAVPGLSPLPAGLAAVEDAAGRVDIKIAGSSPDAFPSDPKDFRFHIRAAARAFSQVLDDQALAPESHLHLGSIEMRIDDPGRAVAHLERAAETLSVRDLRYVALLFLAAARARLSDTDHAEAALREAAVLAPGSDSTARMLAWLYVSTGRPAEASELMRKQLSSPAVWDPLLAYEGGDRFRWFEFIGQLRKGLRE